MPITIYSSKLERPVFKTDSDQNLGKTNRRTGDWPTPKTQSLIITIPEKGNLQLCQNYKTISLISRSSKVMLKVILNRLKPQAEKIIAESCVKSTSNISRICTMSSLISKVSDMGITAHQHKKAISPRIRYKIISPLILKTPLTEFGMQPYGPPCGSTISVQI